MESNKADGWKNLGESHISFLERFNTAWQDDDVTTMCDLMRFDLGKLMDDYAAAFTKFIQVLDERLPAAGTPPPPANAV
jgi:hypothetical protein